MTRHFSVLIHRYAGLAMAGFLVVVGLTGSLLAFLPELQHALSPQFYVADTGLPRLDPATLIERAEALAPEAQADSVWVGESDTARVAVAPRPDPATGKTGELSFNQLALNPYTGEELGRYTWGAISEGLVNLMPFIYKLHYALALDDVGVWILGITALVWTIDCFVAFYLTLPARTHTALTRREREHRRSFWQRWKPAWQIKWCASAYRINFDLHRAGGLWLWVPLLVFAWSSVYMNLWDTVYTKVTLWVFDFHEPWTDLPKREKPLEQARLSWRDAQATGARLMEQAASAQGFAVERPVGLWLDRERGVYVYNVRSSRDIQDHSGQTRVFFDADTGEQRLLLLPTGQYDGNTVTTWLAALHMAHVFGLPYRIFVCVLGLAIVMLSVTGVVIWLRKRRARAEHRNRVAAPQSTERGIAPAGEADDWLF